MQETSGVGFDVTTNVQVTFTSSNCGMTDIISKSAATHRDTAGSSTSGTTDSRVDNSTIPAETSTLDLPRDVPRDLDPTPASHDACTSSSVESIGQCSVDLTMTPTDAGQ